MPTKQIASSTLWQLASQVTMAALSIFMVKFVAIGLSQELAGYYNSAYGFLQLFGILADFGLYAVAVREVSRAGDKREYVLGALITLRSIILILSLSSALLFVWVLPAWRGSPLPVAVSIAALVPFFTLLAGIIRTVFQVEHKMQYVFVAEVTQRIITAGVIGLFIFLGLRGSIDPFYCYLFLLVGGIGAFVLFVISYLAGSRFIRIRPHFDTVLIRSILKRSAPYGLAFFCMALYRQMDVTMIALLRDDFELQNAMYGFAQRMVEMGYLIPTFLLNSVLPTLSERDHAGEDTRTLLGKTFLILLLLGSVASLFSFMWPRPLIHLLATEAYLSTVSTPGSDTALHLLAAPVFLNGIVLYCFYVMLTKHRWKPLVSTLFIAAIISLAMNVWLIPTYGFVGAAWTSIAIHAGLALALLPQALRTMPMHLTASQFLRWLVFSILLGASLWFYQPFLTNQISTIFALVSATVLIGVLAMLCGLHKELLGIPLGKKEPTA